jgi:MFS family permease
MSLAIMMGMAGGYGLGYVNNSWDVINALYGWETTSQKSLWDSLVGSVFSLGAGIGCSVAGKVMQFGRRKSMFLSCVVGIVGCSI